MLKEQADFCVQMQELIESDKTVAEALNGYIEKRTNYLKTLINLGHLNYDVLHAQKPLYASLGKEFFEKEKEIVKTILQKAQKRNELKKIDIDEYAGFFVHVLRTLRLYSFGIKEYWERGSIDKELKKDYTFFTNIFLKSIERI